MAVKLWQWWELCGGSQTCAKIESHMSQRKHERQHAHVLQMSVPCEDWSSAAHFVVLQLLVIRHRGYVSQSHEWHSYIFWGSRWNNTNDPTDDIRIVMSSELSWLILVWQTSVIIRHWFHCGKIKKYDSVFLEPIQGTKRQNVSTSVALIRPLFSRATWLQGWYCWPVSQSVHHFGWMECHEILYKHSWSPGDEA